jgi:hypothetical protein
MMEVMEIARFRWLRRKFPAEEMSEGVGVISHDVEWGVA